MNLEDENKKWVDWIKVFGSKLDKLNSPQFKVKERKDFIEKIIVKQINNYQHSSDVKFKFPYIKDKLIWNVEWKKREGYTLERGKKRLVLLLKNEKKHRLNQFYIMNFNRLLCKNFLKKNGLEAAKKYKSRIIADKWFQIL